MCRYLLLSFSLSTCSPDLQQNKSSFSVMQARKEKADLGTRPVDYML